MDYHCKHTVCIGWISLERFSRKHIYGNSSVDLNHFNKLMGAVTISCNEESSDIK